MICRAIPYEGKEPYIFLSYCHKDANIVYPLVEQMVKDGFRIWYDDGNRAGDDWLENIANHLNRCAVCLAMISENSSVSHNCKSEINEALEWKKKLLAIMLEDFRMPLGMKLQLGTIQYLKRTDFPAKQMLLQKLYESPAMAECRGEPGSMQWRDIPDVQPEQKIEPENDDPSRIVHFVRNEKRNTVRSAVTVSSKVETENNKSEQKEPEQRSSESGTSIKKTILSKVRIRPAAKVAPNLEITPQAQAAPQDEKSSAETARAPRVEDIPRVDTAPREELPASTQTAAKPNMWPDSSEDDETLYDEDETVLDTDDDDATVLDDGQASAVLVRLSTGKAYHLTSTLTRIGRAEKQCDIAITDSGYISNTHAEIIQYNHQYYLRDLNSDNGTFINGSRLSPDGRAELSDMTVFLLHKETFLFLCSDISNLIANDIPVYYLTNTKSQGIRLIDDELYLDRGHRWEDGTLSDEKISRAGKHAIVRLEQNDLWLEDLGSRNGTYLNKSDIRGKGPQMVHKDDQIRLGDTVLRVGMIAL